MATVCYSWDDNIFSWDTCPFTWEEGCVIEKIIQKVGAPLNPNRKERLRDITDRDKEVLIQLFYRMEVDEIVFENRINKTKNVQVNVKLKDVDKDGKVGIIGKDIMKKMLGDKSPDLADSIMLRMFWEIKRMKNTGNYAISFIR